MFWDATLTCVGSLDLKKERKKVPNKLKRSEIISLLFVQFGARLQFLLCRVYS